MTSPQPAGPGPVAAAPETLHAAAIYDSDKDLSSSILAYLIDGISRREKVVVIVPQHTGEVLGSALGSGAMMVQWGLPGLNYEHLGRATETIRGYLADRRAAGEPTRLLTESDVDGGIRGPGRLAAYLRAEAAADGLYGSHGFPWVCLYDRRRYSPGVLADVERVHPHVLSGNGEPFSNQDYVDPASYLAAHPGPVSVVPNEVPLDITLDNLDDLGDIRRQVGEAARGLRLDPADAQLAEVAAGEVIANAFRHGVPPGRVRVWRDADAVLIRVDSGGPGPGVAVAGFQPPDLAAGSGAGMWVVRQVADVVHVETRRDGTIVEMQFPLS